MLHQSFFFRVEWRVALRFMVEANTGSLIFEIAAMFYSSLATNGINRLSTRLFVQNWGFNSTAIIVAHVLSQYDLIAILSRVTLTFCNVTSIYWQGVPQDNPAFYQRRFHRNGGQIICIDDICIIMQDRNIIATLFSYSHRRFTEPRTKPEYTDSIGFAIIKVVTFLIPPWQAT